MFELITAYMKHCSWAMEGCLSSLSRYSQHKVLSALTVSSFTIHFCLTLGNFHSIPPTAKFNPRNLDITFMGRKKGIWKSGCLGSFPGYASDSLCYLE